MKFNSYHNISDDLSQDGSQTVIADVYKANYLALCYFAFKIVNDREEAQDIVMDTFTSLINKSGFNNCQSAKSFLYTAVHNRCVDHMRKQRAKTNYHHFLEASTDIFEAAGNNEVLIAEVLQAIHKEIENLPEQRRIIFKSIYFEGKKTAAIAAELNISQQTVLNQKAKALQSIKISILKSGKYELAILLTTYGILFN